MQKLERYERHTAEEPISIVHQDPDRGFLKLVGLSPVAAGVSIAVDLVLSAEDLITAGLAIPFSLLAAAGLGWITYKLQIKWGDDPDAAKVKAVLIALLTAIPVPITPLLAGPAGLAGLIRNAVRRHE